MLDNRSYVNHDADLTGYLGATLRAPSAIAAETLDATRRLMHAAH